MGMLITKSTPLSDIRFFRPIQSASSPAKSVEITLPSSTAATMNESWPAFRPDVASRYGSAPGDDADVHAVKQAAQAGDEKE